MAQRTPRPFHRGAAVAAALIVAASFTAFGADTRSGQLVDEASSHFEQGELLRAKRSLIDLDRSELTLAERERAFDLMMAIDRRIRHADSNDISLEKAELALEEGDLRAAERQSRAVRRSSSASDAQQKAADEILTATAERKADLAPLATSALEQAIRDFRAARYAEAKAGLESVHRSGVELAPEKLRELNRHRNRIADLERSRGEAFETTYTPLGVFQPGKVTQRDQPGEGERPEQAEDDAEEQAEADEAEAEDNGDAAPEQAEEAPSEPGEGDLLRQAMRADAQRILAEADRAFREARYNTALDKYEQAVGPFAQYLDEDELSRARERLVEVRNQLQVPGGNLLEQEVDVRTVEVQQFRAEFDNFLTDAEGALSEGDTERARTLAQQARLRLASVRDLLSEEEYEEKLDRQRAMLQRIQQVEEEIRQQEAEQRERRLAEQASRQETEREAEKNRKINEALNRVRALQEEQKYSEALQVVDQILFLDPQNPAGLLLKETLRDIIIYRDWDRAQRDKTLSYAEESNRIQEAMVIPDSLLDYPSDWPEISFRRGEPSAFTESEADRRVLAEMDSKRIPASFTDNRLADVVEFIATVTNLNIDVDWESLADIGVDRDDLVTLNLQPLPARVIMDRVLEKVSPDSFSRASWAVQDGIVVVASDQALRQNTFIVIYDVRDLLFEVPSFTNAPTLDLDSVLDQGQGGGGGGGIFEDEDSERDQLSKEELKERLREIIQTNVDFEGWRDNGGDTGIIQELNDNFIITNTARNHRSISGLLRQLREVRSIQINVEARFLLVSQDFFEQIAFDLDVVFNADNSQFEDALVQQSQFQSVLGIDDGRVVRPDRGGRTGLLPSDVSRFFFPSSFPSRSGATNEFIEPDPIDDPGTVQLDAAGFVPNRPENLSMVPANQASNDIVSSLIGSTFATEVMGLNPALQVVGTYLDDVQVDFLVEATQADRRSVTLTAPRLTFTNGNAANIFVTRQTAFVSDLNPIVGTNSVAFDPTIDVVNSGFSLALDGVVSADRRYVTLTIQTALAQLEEFAQGTVNAQTGGNQMGAPSDPVPGNFDLPIVQVTSISTGATIPDRGTLMVGGQRVSSEFEVESGVPVLSKLPIINRFFTNRVETKEEQTLFILIKPTIIIQNEEEEKNFPGLNDSLRDRFGAGF